MNVEVKEVQSKISLAVKRKATMENMAAVMGEGYKIILDYLAELGQKPVCAPYAAYMNCSGDFTEFDLEMGFPVAAEVPVKDDFFMSKSFEGSAATVVYKGAYKDIEPAYNALMENMAENSLESTGVYYDYYISNPDDTPEEELLTEVVFPIK